MVLDDRILCRTDIQSRYETYTQRTGRLESIPVFHAQEYILEISSVYPKVSLSSTLFSGRRNTEIITSKASYSFAYMVLARI